MCQHLQLQLLDSQGLALRTCSWIWAKNHEPRGCIGCHEPPDRTTSPAGFPMAARAPGAEALPFGGEFTYRAKAWRKGILPDETEERNRTVRAVNLIGRQ